MPVPVAETTLEPTPSPPVKPTLVFGYPTEQRALWDTVSPKVYQPTASGRVESALYGTVRTRAVGTHTLPAFHEGLDIAPVRRGRDRKPLDTIHAVAKGRVAYINRVAGNSSYGIYVVLEHEDPIGGIFSLYAHMAKVDPALKVGHMVDLGRDLGLMGNTASTGLPMERAHLHLEVGLLMNRHFHQWYKAQKLVPDHGNFHGHNLAGINPLAIFGSSEGPKPFSMLEHLRGLPPAITLAFRAKKLPDYFQRYPGLWLGDAFVPGAIVLTISEGGVPMFGRNATAEERARTEKTHAAVLAVDEAVIGRNGLRLAQRRNGEWTWTDGGMRWLDIFTYPERAAP